MLQDWVIVVLLTPEQRLQGLNVTDGVSQDLHFGQPLVWVGGRASLEGLKSIVDFSQSSPLTHGGGFAAVCISCFSFAGFARPQQAPAGLVMPAGRPDVLVLDVVMFVGLKQAHVDEPGVQVLEKVHVVGVEAGVIVEIIG